LTSFELPSKYLPIMLLPFDKMLYSNLVNENSGSGHIKCGAAGEPQNINIGNPLNVLGEFLTYLEYFWHNF